MTLFTRFGEFNIPIGRYIESHCHFPFLLVEYSVEVMPVEKETRRGRPRFGEEDKREHHVKFSMSLPPETYSRLEKYCEDEERSKAWVLNKAIIPWLEERGY